MVFSGLENSSRGDPFHAPSTETNSVAGQGEGWHLASGNFKAKSPGGGHNTPPRVTIGGHSSSTTRCVPSGGTSSTIRSLTDMDIDTTRQCKKTPGVTTNSGIRSPPDPSSPDVGTAKTSTEFPPFPIYHG